MTLHMYHQLSLQFSILYNDFVTLLQMCTLFCVSIVSNMIDGHPILSSVHKFNAEP